MEVSLIRNHQNPPEIRQSRPRRDWMDESYKKHAYKCLPLTSANTHGWEVILQQDVTVVLDSPTDIPRVVDGQTITHKLIHTQPQAPEVQPEPEPEPDRRWDGDPPKSWSNEKNQERLQQFRLEPESEPEVIEHSYERDIGMPSIIGIISLAVDWVMNPPEGYSTMISGPPNYFMEGAVPLTAVIPGWWPDPFAMNWKITQYNTPVTFPKGMPYMWFTFVKDDFLSDIRFNVGNTWDDESQMEERQTYGEEKTRKEIEEPWTWVGGIRTGLLEPEGKRVGPKFEGHPVLDVPIWED